ncbi:hypothetical protein LTR50_005977 [Elasticomyces elasticus]|nr:hypothetical protein LTR50_005977 [Elasticomyces elasticus]
MDTLQRDYPWTRSPLVACAPMRLIALAPLAVEVSKAGGLGFIGAGSDIATLASLLSEARQLLSSSVSLATHDDTLPLGVGFLLWAFSTPPDSLLAVLAEHTPAAIWLFAPRRPADLQSWTRRIREATRGRSKIWIQVGTVAEAISAVKDCQPEVLVVQGTDAGGHGLEAGAGLVPLLPEVADAVSSAVTSSSERLYMPALIATGGISDGRGLAASIALGAQGIVMGTRYLAAPEANISQGYQRAVLRSKDGGSTTVRSKVYDGLRGTTDWPRHYGGRGIINESYRDALAGLSAEENKRLYDEAVKTGDAGWGEEGGGGRLTAYAGAGVGLVREVKRAGEITDEVREEGRKVLRRAASKL